MSFKVLLRTAGQPDRRTAGRVGNNNATSWPSTDQLQLDREIMQIIAVIDITPRTIVIKLNSEMIVKIVTS